MLFELTSVKPFTGSQSRRSFRGCSKRLNNRLNVLANPFPASKVMTGAAGLAVVIEVHHMPVPAAGFRLYPEPGWLEMDGGDSHRLDGSR